MRKIATTVFMISLLVPLSAMGNRHRGRGRGGPHHGRGGPGMMGMIEFQASGVHFMLRHPEVAKKRLGITPAQIKKFQAINISYRKKALDVKKRLIPEKLELKKLLLNEKVNLKKVKTQLDKIATQVVAMHMLKIRHRLDVEKVLTKEQRGKLRILMAEWHKRKRARPPIPGG